MPHKTTALISGPPYVRDQKKRGQTYFLLHARNLSWTFSISLLVAWSSTIFFVVLSRFAVNPLNDNEKYVARLVKDVAKLLGKEKILGVVFNRVKVPIINYYGYGKYGKNGGYN